MKQLDAVKTLLHKAAQDEAALRELLPKPEFDTDTLGFHAQQAVEKLLKAWLCFLGVDYPKTHSLTALISLLAENGKALPDGLADMGRLTPFAAVFRYDDMPLGARIDRGALLILVQDTRTFITAQIGELSP